ncbi:MAG: rhodanese-like domain-containing protein [Thermomicrobium sp.]|nr:rhodanese-like domain-containing protein [Thermomicrobium sp.]
MLTRRAFVASAVTLLFTSCRRTVAVPPLAPAASYPGNRFLIEVDELVDRVGDERLRVLDASPLREYNAGHLPGAFHVWWQDTIEIHNDVYGMLVGEPRRTALLREIGLDPDDEVVLYERGDGRGACRWFWFLHAVGFRRVRLLHGGLAAWSAAGYPLTRSLPPRPRSGTFQPVLRYEVLAELPDVRAALGDPTARIVDNRTEEEERETWQGRLRRGRLPGAVSVPWPSLLTGKPPVAFRPPDELAALYRSVDVLPEHRVFVYGLHSPNAAISYVSLCLLDYPTVRVYDGSWAQWGATQDLPIATTAASRR